MIKKINLKINFRILNKNTKIFNSHLIPSKTFCRTKPSTEQEENAKARQIVSLLCGVTKKPIV